MTDDTPEPVLPACPVPLTKLVSPDVDEDEIEEMDARRFRGLRAAITRAELNRP